MPYENKTIETPADLIMRQQQAEQRLKMSKSISDQSKNAEKPEFKDPLIFRFRQFKNTQFAGLWELCALKPDGKVDQLITDADALPNLIEALGNIFSNKGF